VERKLPNQRHLFEIPEDVAYLNCAYMSPQMRPAREAGERALERRAHPWQITPGNFFEEVEEARTLFARLIGGDADGVAIVPSASYGIATAAANVHVEEGQSIVILEEQFPSNVYPWLELAKQRKASVVTVPRPEDHDWTAAVLDHIGQSTAVVAVPNCHWTDGSLLDLVRIGERVREVGAALVVDAIQSLGVYPLRIAEVKPDFLVAPAYKWLLGPYGVGFLYAGEEYRDGMPIEHNWINRAGSEDFAHLVKYRDDFQPGARRYDVGERSNFILLPMALAALRQILSWGVENISETLADLTGLVEEEAAKLGMEATPASIRAPHMLGLRIGSRVPEDLATRLAGQGVYISVRGDSLRVSPHLYNTGEDVSRLFSALKEHVRVRSA
jgi:selenocysteine lyase/cysteine desulfurase